MKTKTKEKILSFVKRALRYEEPKLNPVVKEAPIYTVPLGCTFLLPMKNLNSQDRYIRRQVKDLMSNELLNYVKIKKDNHPSGAIEVTGLLEVVK